MAILVVIAVNEDGYCEVLGAACDFPTEHWPRICTNNVNERLNREIRRCARVVGCFPNGNSALMLSTPTCGWLTEGQQEVLKYEAPRAYLGERIRCRLTSFPKTIDTTPQ